MISHLSDSLDWNHGKLCQDLKIAIFDLETANKNSLQFV